MDYTTFEQRCLELLYKTDAKLTAQYAAYRIGCSVDHAQAHLDAMASRGALELTVGDDGSIVYDVHARPAPTGEPLSWMQTPPAAAMAPVGQPYAAAQHSPPMMMPPPMPQTAVSYQHAPGAPPVHMPVNVQVNNMAPAVIIVGAQKSVVGAVLLGLFFGPLGMLYATGLGALVMFLIGMVLIPITFGVAMPVIAVGCAVWAGVAASQHNQRLSLPPAPIYAG